MMRNLEHLKKEKKRRTLSRLKVDLTGLHELLDACFYSFEVPKVSFHFKKFLSVAVFSGGLTPALVWVGNSRLCLAGLNVLLEEHSVKFAISRSIALTCIILIYKSEPNGSRQHYLIRISKSAHQADPR